MGFCTPFKTLQLINGIPNYLTSKGHHPKINASAIKQYLSAIISVDKAKTLKKINDFFMFRMSILSLDIYKF